MQDKKDGDECFRMMETLCSESDWNWNWNTTHHQLYSSERLWSPVSVIPRPLELETAGGGSGRLTNDSRSAVSRRRRRLLFGSSAPAPHQGITQDDNDNTHVRDEDISHTHN
jgi:hypothetical protein